MEVFRIKIWLYKINILWIITIIDEDVQKLEPSYIAEGNVKW